MYPGSVVDMSQLQYMLERTAEREQLKERIDHMAEFLKEQEDKREFHDSSSSTKGTGKDRETKMKWFWQQKANMMQQ